MKHGAMGPALVLGLLMMAAGGAVAQEAAGNMPLVLEKIRADKKLFVAENLGLTKAEAAKFWPVYDAYQNELFLLRARMAQLINDYREAYPKMTEETARKLVDEYLTVVSLEPKLRKAYLPKFRDALPQIKVLRYYQIENKIQAALMYELGAQIPLAKAGGTKGE
jgi:hypothetical protein